MSSTEKALAMLRNLPRVTLHNIKDYPEYQKLRKLKVNWFQFINLNWNKKTSIIYSNKHALPRGKDAKFKLGSDHAAANKMSRPRLGFAKTTPGYLRIPKEHYYEGHQ